MTRIQAFKERAALYGADTLSDDELLALISGIPIDKTKDILRRYTLQELLKSLDSLDISTDQKVRIECVIIASQRFTRSGLSTSKRITSPDDIGQLFVSELQNKEVETVQVALLDARNRLIRLETLSTGTNNTAVVSPRDIARVAIRHNAVAVIIAHNHPSGDPDPSQSDLDLTKAITDALELMQIRLLDHIIVGGSEFISMRREGRI